MVLGGGGLFLISEVPLCSEVGPSLALRPLSVERGEQAGPSRALSGPSLSLSLSLSLPLSLPPSLSRAYPVRGELAPTSYRRALGPAQDLLGVIFDPLATCGMCPQSEQLHLQVSLSEGTLRGPWRAGLPRT